MKKSTEPKLILRKANDKAAAILVVRVNDGRCEFPDCGKMEFVTAHHGIRKSQCSYHRFSPMNLHCICRSCHTIASHQEALYFAKLKEYDPTLLDFVLTERLKQNRGQLGFKNTLETQKTVAAWLAYAERATTLAEFRQLPRWQDW